MPASKALTDQEHARWRGERGLPELRQVLFWCWDPLRVADAFPFTEDEYDSYGPAVLSLLREEAGAETIAEYLESVERDAMEVSASDAEALRRLGRRIVHWYEASIACWRERAARSD